MNKKIRVGIVGANPERGWARLAHIPALSCFSDFELIAVAEPTRERAEKSAETFGAALAFSDAQELAHSPDVDLVVVTVRVPDHYPVVMAALAANKHIYCEWPLGRTLTETQEMAALSQRTSGVAMIGLQALSSPAVRRAQQLVAEGALGTLLNMRVYSPTAGWATEAPPTYRYLQDRETGATLATIVGGHTLALMEFIAGPIADVQAHNSIRFKTIKIKGTNETVERTSPDHMVVIGRHDNGCVSVLEVVSASPDVFRLELVGTKGSLVINGPGAGGFQTGALTLSVTGIAVTGIAVTGSELPTTNNANNEIEKLNGPALNLAHAYSRLGAAIKNGEVLQPNFKTAENLARLLVAVDRAAEEGRRVSVKD